MMYCLLVAALDNNILYRYTPKSYIIPSAFVVVGKRVTSRNKQQAKSNRQRYAHTLDYIVSPKQRGKQQPVLFLYVLQIPTEEVEIVFFYRYSISVRYNRFIVAILQTCNIIRRIYILYQSQTCRKSKAFTTNKKVKNNYNKNIQWEYSQYNAIIILNYS